MNVELLAEHHFEFLILKGGCTGSSESTPVKIPYCWKSHVVAHLMYAKKDLRIQSLSACIQCQVIHLKCTGRFLRFTQLHVRLTI